MLEKLHAYATRSRIPQKVKIPAIAYLVISEFWEMMQPDIVQSLDEQEAEAYEFVRKELAAIKERQRCRSAYTDVVHAQTPEEKQVAYDEYLQTKEFGDAVMKRYQS